MLNDTMGMERTSKIQTVERLFIGCQEVSGDRREFGEMMELLETMTIVVSKQLYVFVKIHTLK